MNKSKKDKSNVNVVKSVNHMMAQKVKNALDLYTNINLKHEIFYVEDSGDGYSNVMMVDNNERDIKWAKGFVTGILYATDKRNNI